MKRKAPYVYCICRIDSKTWKHINNSLQNRGYSDIKCFIPVVHVLSKSKDKKHQYKEVPMLFNYGFIRMRSNLAFDRNFIRKLSHDVEGITSFLWSLDYMHPKKKKRRTDNLEEWDDFSKVATVTREDFRYYMKTAKANHIYNFNDVVANVGDTIVLRKYPFDGLMAKVIDFNFTNKTAKVEIYPGKGSVLSLQLPLDNIMYTVYDNYDEDNLLVDTSNIDVDTLSEEEEPIDDFEYEID